MSAGAGIPASWFWAGYSSPPVVDPAPAPSCDHDKLRSDLRAYVDGTYRRRAWSPECSEPGTTLVTGTCLECRSNVDVVVPETHPLATAARVNNRLDRLGNQQRCADEQRVEAYEATRAELELWVDELEAVL